MPAELSNLLFEWFGGEENEQLFEQKFGSTPVIFYGEGYGKGIQNGGFYYDKQDFILFDVKINDNWQPRESVEDIANYFQINVVPIVLEGTLNDAVEYIKKKPFSKIAQEVYVMEGVVGRPKIELNDRCSNRVIVKIKVNDFEYNDFL